MSRRSPGALAAALALALCTAPAAEAALSGSDNGYRLRFAGGFTTLTLPAPGTGAYHILCGKPGKEKSLVAIATGGFVRKLVAPGGRPGGGVKRCIVRKRAKGKVATIRLR